MRRVPPTSRQIQWNVQKKKSLYFLSHVTSTKDTQELYLILLVLTKPFNNLPEVCHFVDNSERSSDITPS